MAEQEPSTAKEQNQHSSFQEPKPDNISHHFVGVRGGNVSGSQSYKPHRDDGFPLRGEKYLPLWERILAWCRYANWYGPDWHRGRYAGRYYVNGHLQSRICLHNPHEGFEFSPATEQQLLEVEEAYGFSHPPLLRDLYLHVANGGFGPGTGLIGSSGGFCYWVHRGDVRYNALLKEKYLAEDGKEFCEQMWPELFSPIPFDLETYELSHHQPNLIYLVAGEWPTYFLNISQSEGDGYYYVHAKTGHVYLVDNGFNKVPIRDGQEVAYELHRQADSLEEWFERWLDGEMKDQFWCEADV